MSLASRSRKFINSSASKKGGEKLENVSPSPKQNKVDNVEAPKPTSVKSDKKKTIRQIERILIQKIEMKI